MSLPQPGEITLDDILITEKLSRRPAREPDWQAESEALRSLTRTLVHDPEVMLQSLVDLTVELCETPNATAGVSLVETHDDGEDGFRWVALSCTLSHHIGGCTPRHFSPCGVCLERQAPVLFSYAERYFTYFQEANVPFVEGLVLPLVAEGEALGTIWIITHDEGRQFDAEDVRLMTGLADFTAVALLRNQQQTQELLAANARLEAEAVERKHTEQALRQSEAKYRSLFTSIDEGFNLIEVIFDVQDRAVDVRLLEINSAYEKLNGLPAAVVGQRLREMIPTIEAKVIERYGRVALTGEPVRFEHYVSELDRWFDAHASRVGGAGSRQVVVVFNDISDRKRAEAKLRLAAEADAFRVKLSDRLRSLDNPAAIEEAVTRTALHHFGADRCYYCEIEDGNAIIRRDAAREGLPTVAGVYPLSSFAILQAVIEAGQPFVVRDVRTTDTVDEDLRQLCIQLQVISYIDVPVIKNGRPVGVLCLVQSTPRDWTELEVKLAIETADRTWAAVERARAEQALSRSENQFRLFVTTSSDIVYTMSPDWSEMYQLQGKDFLASTENSIRTWLEQYIPAADQPQVKAAIQNAIQTQSIFELEHRVIRADSSIGWTFSRAIPLFNDQQEIVEWFGAASDITAQKQADAVRRQLLQEKAARREAEQANRMKDEFLSMVSHELQSPLVAILGWTRLLRANPPTRNQLAHQLGIIERNATLQAKLIRDMLDISRILVNRLNLTLQPIDLTDVVETEIASLRPQADEKNIRIEFRLPEEEGNAKYPAGRAKPYKVQNSKLTVLSQKHESGRLGNQFPRVIYRQFRVHVPSGSVQMEALSA